MARIRGVKVKKDVILKNSSSNISHSIKRIKENERKYTILLVGFFFLLFCFIGYFTLRVNSADFLDYYQEQSDEHGVKTSGGLVTLTSNHIMSNQEGLQSDIVLLTIENHLDCSFRYRIIFVEDDYLIDKCGCRGKSYNLSSIHYSIDGVQVKSFSSDSVIVLEDQLNSGNTKNYPIRVWLDESVPISDLHFHGHFVVETM